MRLFQVLTSALFSIQVALSDGSQAVIVSRRLAA